jgi:hypothetical protein
MCQWASYHTCVDSGLIEPITRVAPIVPEHLLINSEKFPDNFEGNERITLPAESPALMRALLSESNEG